MTFITFLEAESSKSELPLPEEKLETLYSEEIIGLLIDLALQGNLKC
jgi:hypothetical protein